MADDAVFTITATERRALADDLDRLTAEQWAIPSLCAGWDVRTVAAHLVAALNPAAGPFLVAVIRSGGRLHRANDALAHREAARSTTELVAALRHHADARSSPPGTGARGPLTDVLVHAGDIRLPLGLPHSPAPDGVRSALDFVTAGRPLGFVPRGRLRGLRLVADDLHQAWGEGEPVVGHGVDLLMAACGRPSVLDRLRGEGAAAMAHRLAP